MFRFQPNFFFKLCSCRSILDIDWIATSTSRLTRIRPQFTDGSNFRAQVRLDPFPRNIAVCKLLPVQSPRLADDKQGYKAERSSNSNRSTETSFHLGLASDDRAIDRSSRYYDDLRPRLRPRTGLRPGSCPLRQASP